MRRIAYPQGTGVELICPSPLYMRAFTAGGGLFPSEEARMQAEENAIEKKSIHPDVVRKFFQAMLSGGEVTATAHNLFRIFRVPFSLQDLAIAHDADPESVEVPHRWFRDAWVIDKGKVTISLDKARKVHWNKIRSQANLARPWLDERDLESLNLAALRLAIMSADSQGELYSIWPAVVPREGRPQ